MIPGLDGLRAIAFLLVFAFHTDYLQIGWIGVQFFFVLSGFLITGILLDMKKSLPPRDYFLKFYGRRFLRIFPLYYFYLLLMAGLLLWLIALHYRINYLNIFFEQVKYAIFYVYDFFFSTIWFKQSYFLNHFWSLSVEEQFYIFWPLLILLVPEKWTKPLFVFFILLGPIFRIAFYFVYYSGIFRFFHQDIAQAVYPLPFTHLDAFAFGAYLSQYSLPKVKSQFFIWLGLVPLLGFTSQYLATGDIGAISAFGYPLEMPHAYEFIWGYSLLNYFFAVTLQAVAKEGLFNQFLEVPFMRYLGKISYGLYVYHFPIIYFAGRIRDVIPDMSEPVAKLLTAIISFAATLLIASLSYRFLEQPLLSLKDRLFAVKRAAA